MAKNNQLPEAGHDHENDHENDPHLLNKKFILHANTPKHMGTLSDVNGYAKGVGVCGDAIEVYLSIDDQTIKDIRHAPQGCTYTVACGSAMAHLVYRRTLTQALRITPEDVAQELDGLPEDHMHCAALTVNTLGEAIDDYYQKIWGGKKSTRKTIPLNASYT
ncbi:MAG: iron-sulfur cluster assembly scaffold protein [Desulfobacteraceae bacterium]|nr:iron-sulfur cluster assembly scaffold protein [Desulfobacteraceae bacterium]